MRVAPAASSDTDSVLKTESVGLFPKLKHSSFISSKYKTHGM